VKLPSIGVKGLGGKLGALLPRRKRKRKRDDDEDDDFDDVDDDDAEEPDSDEDFDDDDEDGGGRKKRPSKRLIIVAAASVAGLVVLGGAGWWFFAGSEESAEGERAAADTGSGAVVAMPPKSQASGMMSPPSQGTGSPEAAATAGPNAGVVIPPVTAASYAAVAELPPATPLPPSPDPTLVEQGPQGTLPKIAEDGRTPLQAYARPFDSRDDRPKIAIVVAGLGLSRAATEAAIRRLPASVTLAFDAYAPDLDVWAAAAREAGHELLVGLPMESSEFPVHDPGPFALLTTLPSGDNIQRMEQVLARLSGYVGVLGVHGSAFGARADVVRPILTALKGRGLMFVDGTDGDETVAPKIATEIGLPRAFVDLVVDAEPSKAGIDAGLARLESLVRERAVVVAVARPYPVTVERLRAWVATLDSKNLVLAPVSAVADRQFLP